MELRTLKYFVTIAEEGNISRAAERLYLTQPTLSRQMINLEDELGVKLFNRGKNSLTLTPEGMLLNRRAQDILYLADKVEDEVSQKGKELTGIISIGVGEMHGSMEIAEVIAEFQKMHPEVQFDLHGGRETYVREKLDKNLLDLGIITKPVDTSKYDFVEMKTQEQWSAVMREDSPLAERDEVRPADFIGEDLIITEDPMGQRHILHWLGDYKDKMKIVATVNMEHNAYQLVKSGARIAICFIKEGFPGEGVCCRPLDAGWEVRIDWSLSNETYFTHTQLAEYGFVGTVYAAEDNSIPNQITQLENILTVGEAAGVCIQTGDLAAIKDVVLQLQDAGITVVVYGIECDYDTIVAMADVYNIGY